LDWNKRTHRMLFWSLAAALAVGIGALRAEAQWHLTPNINAIDYNSNGVPVGGAGDDKFKRVMIGGVNGAKFDFKFCCADPTAICPPGDTLGAAVILTVKVATINGVTDPSTTPPIWCCTQCCGMNGQFDSSNFSINGVQGAAWGGAALQLSIDAYIECICCRNGAWWTTEAGSGGTTGSIVLNWF